MATALPPPHLPFSVVEYVNPRTKSTSYRVKGTWRGKRFRQNKPTAAQAHALCDFKNAEALRDRAVASPARYVQTRLADEDLVALEAVLDKSGRRWPAAVILDAGLEALAAQPADVLLEPRFREWLERMKGDLGRRWHHEITKRGEYFFRQNPGLTARRLTPEFFARWLGGLKCKGQTKANYRNALSRWAADMKTEGVLAVNPCAGMRISRKKDRSAAPRILTPAQAEAFLAVHLFHPELAPQLGWVIECLFVGLRPQNEAPRAVWKEIDLDAGEQSVLGYKRGVKPRHVTLHPTAAGWLRHFKAQRRAVLAPYTRHLRRLAVKHANTWLAARGGRTAPIEWDEDILRHTFASMRAAAGVDVVKLAEEMGTSTRMIYSHYRHARPAAEARQFWALTVTKLLRARR
jgi:site-specific recombinase XerD